MANDIYTRQIPFVTEVGQRRIESAHVGIVGLGGIGLQVAQGLAYLGVGSFLLIDDDHIDSSNLNRSVGAFLPDAEAKALKVTIAERMIRQIKPEASVQAIPQNLRSRVAMEALISCPVIFGCVDRDGSRLILMELAAAYAVNLIDSASEINLENPKDSVAGGRVVVARPGDFCLNCAGEIDLQTAKQELLTPATRELLRAHGYGLGAQGVAASVVSLNGVVANLAITEFVFLTTGIQEPDRYLAYYASRGTVNNRQVKRRVDCYTCGYLAGIHERANILRYALPDTSNDANNEALESG